MSELMTTTTPPPQQNWWQRFIAWLFRREYQTEQLAEELIDRTPIKVTLTAKVEQAEPQAEPEPEPEPEREKRKYDTTYLHLRRDLAKSADEVLNHLENLAGSYTRELTDDAVAVRILENLWGCDFLLWDPDLFQRMEGSDKWSAIDPKGVEAEMADAIWPIDFAIATVEENHVRLYRVATVTPEQVRGKVRLVFPKMVQLSEGRFKKNGKWATTCAYLGMSGNKWVLTDDGMEHGTAHTKFREYAHLIASRITSVALTSRYEWHVAFGTMINGPRLLLPTNPNGCLQLFKNRDLAPGKVRREALKHWVEEHWRDREDAGIAYVCHHLRGHTRFGWSGFDCELFVSAYDLEKNEYFKEQAKEWRAQRKHNRVRVHLKKKKK